MGAVEWGSEGGQGGSDEEPGNGGCDEGRQGGGAADEASQLSNVRATEREGGEQ